MTYASKDYIINTIFRTNILPITSSCNTACIFCSHKYNPEGIQVFCLQKMNLAEYEEIISFLSPDKKIVIGESATRIIEGEPLLHEDFIHILELLRRKFPNTTIQITTNGILLDESLVNKMEQLGNIELNISVNCIHPLKRRQVLGLKNDDNIRDKINMLKGRLKFSGSCVLVPDIMDWADVEDIVAFLNDNMGDTVRMFLPGYTAKAEKQMDLIQLYHDAVKFVECMRQKYEIPVIIEPSFINDLECKIEGVIRQTPAYDAGMKVGDILVSINDQQIETRVHGFNEVYRLANPELIVKRGSKFIKLKLRKKRKSSPGFIVLYDIDPTLTEQINEAVKRHSAKRVLFLTSELAYDILGELFEKSCFEFNYDILKVKNSFFGGTIKCAGLLTVQDILEAGAEYLNHNPRPDLIMLPPIIFDFTRKDLMGRGMKEIEEMLGVTVDTI